MFIKKNKEGFINLRINKKLIDHDIYPDHFHTNERLAQHEYLECMDKNKNDSIAKKKCEEDKKKVFIKEAQARNELVQNYVKKNVHYCIENKLKNIQKTKCSQDCNSVNNLSQIVKDKCSSINKKCNDKYEKLYKCNNEKDENICKTNLLYSDLHTKCKGGFKSSGINFDIKNSFIGNILSKIIVAGKFQRIYYLFTTFAFVLIFGIGINILWWFLQIANKISGDKFAKHFPGRIVWDPLNFYFNNIHKYILYFFSHIFIFLLGIVMLLYFFKKLFGWWPASWVWSSIGLFKGSGPAFSWIDSFFGCFSSGGPLFCNNQAMWNLIEDWVVMTCKKNNKNCYNKSEDEIREALNSFKTMTERYKYSNIDTDKNIETFQNNIKSYDNIKNNNHKHNFDYKYKNKFIEEFYTFSEKLDNIDNSMNYLFDFSDTIDQKIMSDKENIDEEGDNGEEQRKKYDDEESEDES